MSNIVIIVGHVRPGSYCEALGKAYKNGATVGGHKAEMYSTAKLSFNPILREGFDRLQPLEPDLATVHDAILAADHLVFIFPLWLGTLPAIFKGFLERVLQPDILEGAQAGKFPKPLKGKSARVIMTMGMPGIIYRWYFGAHSLKMFRRNILNFVGVSPVRSTIYGSVSSVAPTKRTAWLSQVEAMGKDGS